MRLWHVVRTRLRSLLFRGGRESDLHEELALHLERETERLQAAGLPEDAARRQALRSFGGIELTKDECRDARGTALVDNLMRDIRFALRSFGRAPLAAVTIVATLGIGLGPVAAVFTVLNTFVFRPDDVRNPHELFGIDRPRPDATEADTPFIRPDLESLLDETSLFSGAFATTPDVDAWIDGQRRQGRLVTGNFFHVLGVSPALGRVLTPADDVIGRPPVIVLSYRGWSQYFGGDPDIVNRTVQVNRTPFHIVGVMPQGFRGLEVAAPDYWAPLATIGHIQPDAAGLEAAAVGVNIVEVPPAMSSRSLVPVRSNAPKEGSSRANAK